MLHKCNITSLEAKISKLVREEKPTKRFKPLFEHLINLARDSAKRGYCQRAGQELRHARKIARYR